MNSSDQGREADRFDRYCDHVVISRRDTGEMVGTYRLLPPEGAAQADGSRFPSPTGGRLAAICWDRVTAGGHPAPEHYRVRPRTPWTPPAAKTRPGLQLPPKLRGYLLAGAWVCGGFAYDPQHDEVALYLLLSLENTDPHRQNFLLSLAENQAGPHMR